MKKIEKSATAKRSMNEIISLLNNNDILDLNAMRSVKGGEGNGDELIIFPIPIPKEGN